MAHFVLPNTGHKLNPESAKMGMWLFLFTEILLFGGLFLVYFVYRTVHHEAFYHAHQELNVTLGTINTVILLTSSLTMAMSITALRRKNIKLTQNLLWLTLLAAAVFLVNKYFEWGAKIDHGIFPGMEYYDTLPGGERLFFFLYYFMTGLHALHVIVGGLFILIIMQKIDSGKVTPQRYMLLENSGLYWHLVDLIWIYLFPLFYLIH